MNDCAHAIPYLTGYDCERCGATPEQMSSDPERFRAETDQARAWGAKHRPDLAATGLSMTLEAIEAVREPRDLWDDVYWALRRAGMGARATREFVNTMRPKMRAEILREAAAKIRADADETARADDPRWNGMNTAADLIDPDQEQP